MMFLCTRGSNKIVLGWRHVALSIMHSVDKLEMI